MQTLSYLLITFCVVLFCMIEINRRKFLGLSLSSIGYLSLIKNSFSLNPDVIVIGAGAAGLAATDHLLKAGYSVVCIEADNRIGGRVHTDNDTFGVPYDIGAHWIQNGRDNPYKKYGQKEESLDVYPEQETEWLVMDGNKKINGTKAEDELWEQYYAAEQAMNRAGSKDISPSKVIPNLHPEWFDTTHLNIGPYSMAKDYGHFSCIDWNNYAPESQDWHCTQGYGALVAYKWRNVPVSLNTEAVNIKWGDNIIQVETNKGTIESKKCIITTSNGVLSSEKIKFFPKLPLSKIESFNGITMGVYNHVGILLDENIFGTKKNDVYMYYKLKNKNINSPQGMGSFLNASGSGLSYFDTAGEFGRELENQGSDAMIDFTLSELKSLFGSNIEKHFIKAAATSWGNNRFTYGAYASAEPGSYKYRTLIKEPVDDKLFFAGEATAVEYASVSGAHRSGIRAAKEAIKSLNGF
jgi:monoamine oxidase